MISPLFKTSGKVSGGGTLEIVDIAEIRLHTGDAFTFFEASASWQTNLYHAEEIDIRQKYRQLGYEPVYLHKIRFWLKGTLTEDTTDKCNWFKFTEAQKIPVDVILNAQAHSIYNVHFSAGDSESHDIESYLDYRGVDHQVSWIAEVFFYCRKL